MSFLRNPSKEEKAVISALLQSKPETQHFINTLNDLRVIEMDDGGMGSRLLVPEGLEKVNRSFGKQIVLGEFFDGDGIPVSVTINVDREGMLYELDVWKVNFAPLLHWPDPSTIRIIKQ